VLPLFGSAQDGSGFMKQSKFTSRQGLVMLLGLTLMLVVMLWLVLSGILQIND
jgi:hypothetical protein